MTSDLKFSGVPSSPPQNHSTEMLLIPGGQFLMGSEDGGNAEKPLHHVNIDDFLLDVTPVTNENFQHFIEESGHITEAEKNGKSWGYDGTEFREIPNLSWRSFSNPERENHPVVLVSWSDAVAYSIWAGKRLPTEAEWEKAARGGLQGKPYPWGSTEPDGTQCNFARKPSLTPSTTDVLAFPPNAFGLRDMVGNVWQWCSDFYSDSYYSQPLVLNPTGPERGEHRVRRGGSWNVIQPFRLRCANRGAIEPTMTVPNLGFRCAKNVALK